MRSGGLPAARHRWWWRRLRPRRFVCATPSTTANLARMVRKGDWLDLEKLVQHLNIVGYRQTDVVEQQGEYAQRGGILDVYSPEMERPVRIELFGDEVESVRRFDPVTQRSAMSLEEAALLPLTETPVTEELLATINARLSGKRVSGSEEALEDAARAGGVTVFPGWEFFAPVAGAENTIFDLMADAAVVLDEPERLAEDHDGWWQRLAGCARAQRRWKPGASGGVVRYSRGVARARGGDLRTGRGATWIGVERWRGVGGVQLASHAALPWRGAEAAGGSEEALRGGRARDAGGGLDGRVGTPGGYFQ